MSRNIEQDLHFPTMVDNDDGSMISPDKPIYKLVDPDNLRTVIKSKEGYTR